MSLLQKASIITTPTAYAEDYLYSIKPAYALGSELVTQFDGVADGTDVATLTGWFGYGAATSRNVVDEKLVIVTSAGNQGARLNATTIVGTKYLFKAKATGDLGTNGIYISSGSLNLNKDTSSGNIEVTFTALSTTTDVFFRTSSNAAGTTTYADISLKEVTDADFDFDRNSTGTRVNEDYLIEDVPYNLVTNSETFSNWTKNNTTVTVNSIIAPDRTLSGALLQGSTVSNRHNVARTGISDEQTVTLSVFVKKKELRYVQIASANTNGQHANFDIQNVVVGNVGAAFSNAKIKSVGNGWYRLSVVSLNRYNSFYISLISGLTAAWLESWSMTNNTDGLYIWGAQIVKGDQPKEYLKTTDRLDIPRIDYTNGEPSILLEPSRTNLVTNSDDFSTNWTLLGASVTVNQITSPDGNTKGGLLENTGTGTALIEPSGLSLTVGVTYTYSVFVKKGNNQWVRLAHISSGVTGCWFDLDNGVLGTVNSTSATIDKYPNGWYRITNTFVATSTATARSAFIGICDNNGSTHSGAIGQNVYIYGAQVEAASYATSLIHTSGSTVTRSADAVRNAGNSDLISNSEGVLYAELARTSDNANYELIAISSGVANYQNIVALGFDANNNEIWYRAKLGNTDLIIVSAGAEVRPQNEFFKIAVKYKSGDSKVYLNGRMIDSTTTTGSTSVAFTTLDLAFYNIYNFNGKLKNVTVFKEALTDLELEKLTGYNNHELYMNYYNRLSYLGLAEEYNVESDINNYIL